MKQIAVLFAAVLSGCVSTGGTYYRVGETAPASGPDLELAQAVCEGRVAEAKLSMGSGAIGTISGPPRIMRGCMAERGYIAKS